ncbi:MAG TPA: hypothetical protein PLJ37_10285 [Chitinophagales bacterium]|nr:hypothetical protein [Chitinophagales bacterium]HMY41899.1 hypothetical protein [Chitinophagales bacterium]HNG27790.1 hypothetical protein [Chitinophagales bacterium]
MYKIKFTNKQNDLSEIFQNKEILFSFAAKENNNTFVTLSKPAKCRDFMNDVIYINKHHTEINKTNIYGFNYNYNVNPHMDDKNSIYYIDFKNNREFQNFTQQVDRLQTIEKELGLQQCEILKTENPFDIILIADKIWTEKILLNNIYTYLIKCLSYTITNKTNSLLQDIENTLVDCGQVVENVYFDIIGINTLNYFLNNIRTINNHQSQYCDGNDDKRDISSIHNYTGMCAYKSKYTPPNKLFDYLKEKEKSWQADAKHVIQF